jgi:hypothetical protein
MNIYYETINAFIDFWHIPKKQKAHLWQAIQVRGVMVSVLISCVLDMYIFGSTHDRVKPKTIKLILAHSVKQ